MRKYDWCYFTDGSKKKITHWYKYDEDILFVIDGKLHLYKENNFRFEYEEYAIRQGLFTVLPRGSFYIHRSPTLHYPLGDYDKDNYDEWYNITSIERIELRQ